MLELLQYHSHQVNQEIISQPSNQLGCSHIALTVKSLNSALQLIQNLGGSLVNPPAEAPNKMARVAYCHDKEGVLFHDRLVHFGPINKNKKIRISAECNIICR